MKLLIRFSDYRIVALLVICMAVASCDKANLPPVADLTIFPPVGDSLTIFEYRAGESADDRNYAKGLVCRWDFDGDGQWDTGYDQSKTTSHRFPDPGIYAGVVEVKDLEGLTSVARDTVVVNGLNRDIDTLTDTRDGNRYRIVKILDRWWMAENLHYGLEIPVDRIQTNNGITEMYRNAGRISMDSSCGVYHWLEAMDYQVKDPKGICQDGWHIPTRQEWNALFAPYPYLYDLQYYGAKGLSGLNLDLQNGATRWTDGSFWWAHVKSYESQFWTSSFKILNGIYHPYTVEFESPYYGLAVSSWAEDANILEGGDPVMYYPIRCIKDK